MEANQCKRSTFDVVLAIQNERQQAYVAGDHSGLNVTGCDVQLPGGIAVHVACVENVANISASKEQYLSGYFAWNISGKTNCRCVADWVEKRHKVGYSWMSHARCRVGDTVMKVSCAHRIGKTRPILDDLRDRRVEKRGCNIPVCPLRR